MGGSRRSRRGGSRPKLQKKQSSQEEVIADDADLTQSLTDLNSVELYINESPRSTTASPSSRTGPTLTRHAEQTPLPDADAAGHRVAIKLTNSDSGGSSSSDQTAAQPAPEYYLISEFASGQERTISPRRQLVADGLVPDPTPVSSAFSTTEPDHTSPMTITAPVMPVFTQEMHCQTEATIQSSSTQTITVSSTVAGTLLQEVLRLRAHVVRLEDDKQAERDDMSQREAELSSQLVTLLTLVNQDRKMISSRLALRDTRIAQLTAENAKLRMDARVSLVPPHAGRAEPWRGEQFGSRVKSASTMNLTEVTQDDTSPDRDPPRFGSSVLHFASSLLNLTELESGDVTNGPASGRGSRSSFKKFFSRWKEPSDKTLKPILRNPKSSKRPERRVSIANFPQLQTERAQQAASSTVQRRMSSIQDTSESSRRIDEEETAEISVNGHDTGYVTVSSEEDTSVNPLGGRQQRYSKRFSKSRSASTTSPTEHSIHSKRNEFRRSSAAPTTQYH